MVRKKNTKLQDLIKVDKSYEKINSEVINDKITLYYAEKIGYQDIDLLLKELSDTFTEANTKGLEFPVNDLHAVEYLQFLIFKYMTNLKEMLEVAEADFELNIVTYRDLYNKGIMQKIMNNIDIVEIEKVFDKYYELGKLGREIESYKKETIEQLKPEITTDHAHKMLDKLKVNG